LSDTILKLQDEGVIQKYYNKWWKEEANLKCDQEDKRKDITAELGFANIGGIFVILAAGIVLSVFVAAIEFSIKIRNRKGRQVKLILLRLSISCLNRDSKMSLLMFIFLFSRFPFLKK
jgi:hypothetical protein